MIGDLICAGAVLVPLMTVVLWLAPSCKRVLTALAGAHVATSAERDAAVQDQLLGIEEKRHALALRHGTLGEDTAVRKARLLAEAAEYEQDAEATRRTLDDAIAGRRKALAARAEAEASLAPEAAMKALEAGSSEMMEALSTAYREFCRQYGYPEIPTFATWIQGFEGLGGLRG